jgi:hypothetical protein
MKKVAMRFLLRRRQPPKPEWTVVASAAGSLEAEIVAGLLRTAGIPCFIQQESAARAIGLTMGLGAINVLVPSQFEEEALVLLDAPTLDEQPPAIDEPPIKF